ncbi:MAG TPA: type II secretion system protein GspG [Spirochaeta sp.]|nr:type II secretion system protein GspG [Spirochaeta sp.]
MKNKRNKWEEGWTFVETLIVIAIVLILTSSVGFMAFKYIDKAKVVTAKTQIENLNLALNSYFFDNKQFPSQDQGLEALWKKTNISPVPEDWSGPYVEKDIPLDPWGNEFEYTVPGPHGLPFGIRSFGSDGLEGGEDLEKDITSWEN